MLKLSLGILFMAVSSQAAHAEPTWSGGAGVRHLWRKLDDGLSNVDTNGKNTSKSTEQRWEYRASLGLFNKTDNLDWGINVRTQPATSVTAEWVSNSSSKDISVAFSEAFGRWHHKWDDFDFSLTFGRAKTVLAYDNVVQALFDNDVRWDGFGWSFKYGMFGLNAVQYVLGASNQGATGTSSYSKTESSDSNADQQSHFAMLYAFQPYMNFKFNDDISEMFAIGWLNWSGTGASSTAGLYQNAVHGGTGAFTSGTAADPTNTTAVNVDNSSQWQFLSDTSLPYNLRLLGELIMNHKVYYGPRNAPFTGAVAANRTAWAASLTWGKPKKAGDIFLAYSYGVKGIGSVINTFTNGDVAPDNKSHFLEGRYMYADNVAFIAKVQFHSEKALLGGDGQALTGVNAGRKQTYNRYELVSNMSF